MAVPGTPRPEEAVAVAAATEQKQRSVAICSLKCPELFPVPAASVSPQPPVSAVISVVDKARLLPLGNVCFICKTG